MCFDWQPISGQACTPTRALTFYKAQGLTLAKVLVRIKSIRNGKEYEYRHKFGLLYTAFSRVRDMNDLRITHHTRDLWPRADYHRLFVHSGRME